MKNCSTHQRRLSSPYRVLLSTALVCSAFFAQAQIFVDQSAAGANNGTSWANAYTNLQDAIDAAAPGSDLWVAAGTYLPADYPAGCIACATNKDYAFHINKNIELYGGFAGDETALSQRDLTANATILSGDFNADDTASGTGASLAIGNNGENANHVLILANLTAAAVIDGFTIQGGHANQAGTIDYAGHNFTGGFGGGIYSISASPLIRQCTFLHNTARYGAGQYNMLSSPAMSSCTFRENLANFHGGGQYNRESAPALTTCAFTGNRAKANGGGQVNAYGSAAVLTACIFTSNAAPWGGGQFNSESSPILAKCAFVANTAQYAAGQANMYSSNSTTTNCVFNKNIATYWGGGQLNGEASPTTINCTFNENSAGLNGGGQYNLSAATPTVVNVIFWNNLKGGQNNVAGADIANDNSTPTVSFSLTQANSSYSAGPGILNNQDPLFVDAAAGILRLQPGSPAADAGTSAGAPADDFNGNPRPFNVLFDMGAFEYQGELPNGWSVDTSFACNGTTIFNPATQIYTTTSVGCFYSSPYTKDQVIFAKRQLCGNGSITTHVTSVSALGWAGIIIREAGVQNTKKVQLMTNRNAFNRREVRYTTGGASFPQNFSAQSRYWLRLVRQGNQVIGYVSTNGVNWTNIMVVGISMTSCVEIGLVVTNVNTTSTTTATFANVDVVGAMMLDGGELPQGLAQDEASTGLSAYPNPTSGALTLDVSEFIDQQATLIVQDALGRTQRTESLGALQNATESLDLSGLPAGIYYLRLRLAQSGEERIQKIVLQPRP